MCLFLHKNKVGKKSARSLAEYQKICNIFTCDRVGGPGLDIFDADSEIPDLEKQKQVLFQSKRTHLTYNKYLDLGKLSKKKQRK